MAEDILMFSKCLKIILSIILIFNQNINSSGLVYPEGNRGVSSTAYDPSPNDQINQDLVYLNRNYFQQFLSSELSRYKRQSINNEQRCQIPKEPLHTKYIILGKSETSYKSGNYVETTSTLEVNCDEGYQYISFIAPKYSVCRNGKWDPSPTNCIRSCPPLISTETTTVKCTYKDIPLSDCFNPIDETTAILSCAPFYEEANLARNPFRICRNGKWQPSIVECYPTCGIKTPKGVPNIVQGRNATRGDYPWQTGVYDSNKELICGGSIIGQKVILSAAHCFADYNGNMQPPENYYIGAGKYYREYNDDRDDLAQYSKVLAIHIPDQYKANYHFYANDIAIIALKDPFTFSQVLQPICIGLNKYIQNVHIPSNATAIVTGWGYTKEGSHLSEVLKELEIPLIPYETCYIGVPAIFRRFITSDKICGGYISQGKSVCAGDSGGALVFQNVADNRHYVIGIVSTSPSTVELVCDSNMYSLYTQVSQHIQFVGKYIQYYNTDQSVECKSLDDCKNRELQDKNSCFIPNFPLNGKYISFHDDVTYVPGDYVPLGSKLLLSCDDGYEVSSSSETEFYCVNKEQWTSALGTCKKLEVTPGTCSVPGLVSDGLCMKLNDCIPFKRIVSLLDSPIDRGTKLQELICGYEAMIPKVCCAVVYN